MESSRKRINGNGFIHKLRKPDPRPQYAMQWANSYRILAIKEHLYEIHAKWNKDERKRDKGKAKAKDQKDHN